jgi:imidazolonepropionase-like amidohydrolase
VRQSIEAGCDSLELVTDIDEQLVRMLVERGTYINFALTITKIQATHQNFPMAEMSKASFQRALRAGAKIAFSVNATGARGKQEGPYHGEGAIEFANMVEYGMTPLQALRSATSIGADSAGPTGSDRSRRANTPTLLRCPAILQSMSRKWNG